MTLLRWLAALTLISYGIGLIISATLLAIDRGGI